MTYTEFISNCMHQGLTMQQAEHAFKLAKRSKDVRWSLSCASWANDDQFFVISQGLEESGEKVLSQVKFYAQRWASAARMLEAKTGFAMGLSEEQVATYFRYNVASNIMAVVRDALQQGVAIAQAQFALQGWSAIGTVEIALKGFLKGLTEVQVESYYKQWADSKQMQVALSGILAGLTPTHLSCFYKQEISAEAMTLINEALIHGSPLELATLLAKSWATEATVSACIKGYEHGISVRDLGHLYVRGMNSKQISAACSGLLLKIPIGQILQFYQWDITWEQQHLIFNSIYNGLSAETIRENFDLYPSQPYPCSTKLEFLLQALTAGIPMDALGSPREQSWPTAAHCSFLQQGLSAGMPEDLFRYFRRLRPTPQELQQCLDIWKSDSNIELTEFYLAGILCEDKRLKAYEYLSEGLTPIALGKLQKLNLPADEMLFASEVLRDPVASQMFTLLVLTPNLSMPQRHLGLLGVRGGLSREQLQLYYHPWIPLGNMLEIQQRILQGDSAHEIDEYIQATCPKEREHPEDAATRNQLRIQEQSVEATLTDFDNFLGTDSFN